MLPIVALLVLMPPCDNGTRAGLRPVPFRFPGSIPGGGVLKKLHAGDNRGL